MEQEYLAAKFKKLPEWESGETQPTLKQLEAFARAVCVPFSYLFLSEPPDERLPISDFRTVRDTAKTNASLELIDTLYAMQSRQAWLREYLIENDAEPLTFAASARLADDPEAVGRSFKVSPVVVTRRAMDLNLVERSAFFDFYERYINREHRGNTTPSRGNFYNNQNTRVGKLFAIHVMRAAMEGQIGFREACKLTGLRGESFQDYANCLKTLHLARNIDLYKRVTTTE